MSADADLDAWRSLLSGKWEIVEVFDRDGRRFMVGRKSDEPRPLLTPREEVVLAMRARAFALKQIAYDLGISEATVSRVLARGMAKLGLTTAGDLTRFTT